MKIGIISDLHLGYRQYGSIEREEDFYTHFIKCMNAIKECDVDLLIVAGDIFDKPNPSPQAMNVYRKGISLLGEIPIYTITGNHTMLMRDNHYTVDNYFSDSTLNSYYLIDDSILCEKDFDITGIMYRSDTDLDSFHEIREELLDSQAESSFQILVIHQAIKEFCGFTGAELSIDDLDIDNYDLIVCGHIHSPFWTNVHDGSTVFIQPGSIERMNTTEAADEIEKGKGFFIYDTETSDVDFHKVSSPRKFLMGDIEFNTLEEIEEHFDKLQDEIKELSCPPIISYNYYDNTGHIVYIRDLMKDLEGTLINNSNIYDLTNEIPSVEISEGEMPTVLEVLDSSGKEVLENDNAVQLAKDIFNAYDKDNEDSIEGILDTFFKKNYGDNSDQIDERYLQHKKEIKEYEEFFNNLGGDLDV